ncbi:MAG: hypothetical protein M1820_003017 [Bogoriella megaspora]|nr:MAG: hypothetical protein M1820_003017 [Bogoriella megaspora]
MDSGVDHDVSFAMLEDHLSKCSDKERARLDEKLYELLSDHAAVNEVLTLVRLHRPRAYKDRFGPVRIGRGGLTMMEQGKFFQLIPPEYLVTGVLVERLSMATLSGMRDQKWVEAFDKYQEDSSIFWASFRNVHRNWLEKMHWPIEDIDAEIQYLSANLDPVYLKSVEALRAEVLANLHPKPQSPLRIELQTQWGLEESVEKITIQEKSKIKTRPEAKAPDMTQEVRDGSEDVPAESFVVKKQSHAFFCKLYPPKKTDVVKQASWPEFTSAMASIGFSITHLEGSRVRFDKKDGGKIIFDEPHGKSTKIESEKMYAIKSRLTRRFGFTRDTFILEE